ncbi:MAG TPA: XdhC family protein [Pyrinomonadaceae bacterium]|jgi:xanthine dehydrogenase accessory factor|nr:XdhC family protein [Pyrinomonadaceae bacterium]
MSIDATTPKTLTQHLERVLAGGATAALVTLVKAEINAGRKMLIERSGEITGSLGNSELDKAVGGYGERFLESQDRTSTLDVAQLLPEQSDWQNAKLMFERIEPEPRIVICGAGHVGAALARLAGLIGYWGTLIDDRREFLSRDVVSDERISFLFTTEWFESVREALGNGRGVSVAVVTRGHNEDEICLRAVMSTEVDYVGMIGSKRRTNIVLDRLREAGADEERLRRVHAPIGLDIGAVTPEEVALAIMAEVVARRRGGSGLPLSAWRRQ